jgi:hypothetical protein
MFDTKKKQGSSSHRFFRLPQALGHSTRLHRRSFRFCLARLEMFRWMDGKSGRWLFPQGRGIVCLRRSRG